jgi:hypothetical protein
MLTPSCPDVAFEETTTPRTLGFLQGLFKGGIGSAEPVLLNYLHNLPSPRLL